MPAYVISDVEVLDSDGVATYRTLARESIEDRSRNMADATSCGAARLKPLSAIGCRRQSSSLNSPPWRAREWCQSSDYAEALKVRQYALKRKLIFVERVTA